MDSKTKRQRSCNCPTGDCVEGCDGWEPTDEYVIVEEPDEYIVELRREERSKWRSESWRPTETFNPEVPEPVPRMWFEDFLFYVVVSGAAVLATAALLSSRRKRK